jgi:precorrin-6A/cobalt-precorrin-6A reductase
VVTVTTETARSLYPDSPLVWVEVGRLDLEALKAFIQEYQICCIVDASHPFAVVVSQLAIAAAEQYQLPYLRFEREQMAQESREEGFSFASFEALLATDILVGERVLLTIGYRSLALFDTWQSRSTLFARILPSITALEAALMAGFTPDRLIALRPPISLELERALWQQWQISLVVTKASGKPGGEDVKRQLAAELSVKLAVIDRPILKYPQWTNDLEQAIGFCQQAVQA